jgi:hypothetical protein
MPYWFGAVVSVAAKLQNCGQLPILKRKKAADSRLSRRLLCPIINLNHYTYYKKYAKDGFVRYFLFQP